MKLRKVISGGQTGADRTGLECAKELGIETGGTAPKGYRTDIGLDPTLKDFGVVESPYTDYKPRTKQNVKDADVTIWFGYTGSPGFWCTRNAASELCKPFVVNPSPEEFQHLADTYEVFNIAGNRKRLNAHVCATVRHAFEALRE